MYILSILIIGILDQQSLLNTIRNKFISLLTQYLGIFDKYETKNQRQIRYLHLFAVIPIFLALILIKIIVIKFQTLGEVIDSILFLLSVQIFAWKKEATAHNSSMQSFINTYAIKFFAPLFWFVVIPTFGPICYLTLTLMSAKIKDKSHDIIVYDITVDKMLFYINIIPFLVLYFFLAVAGNFEEVLYFILSKKTEFSSKSFYFLEELLKDVILISIGKSKFQNNVLTSEADDFGGDYVLEEKLSTKITPYIIAMLYRTGLFFVSILAIIDLTIIIH